MRMAGYYTNMYPRYNELSGFHEEFSSGQLSNLKGIDNHIKLLYKNNCS